MLPKGVTLFAPCLLGGFKSHATDPGKPDGAHFMPEKKCDSMASTDRAKRIHVTNPGEPNGVHFMPKEKCHSMESTDCGKKSHATDPSKADGIHFMPKELCIVVSTDCVWSFFWRGKVHTRKEQ